MKCPVCKEVTLMISERQGIEIDYCPECRGVWLDRGELDKMIEKADNYNNREEKEYNQPKEYSHSKEYNHSKDYKGHDGYQKPHKKKKESFMGDIFDIFGG